MLMKATSAKLGSEQKQAKIYFSAEEYLKKRPVIEEAAKASTINQVIHAFKGTDYWSALEHGAEKLRRKRLNSMF